MRHLQGKTTIISDNSTAVGITNKTVKHKRSKAMVMKFTVSKTEKHKDNSNSFGDQDRIMKEQITLQKTIQPNITKT